jgi:hypothetical protein
MGNDLTPAAAGSGTESHSTSAPARPAISPRAARRGVVALVCAAAVLASTAGCSVMAEEAADATNESGAPAAAAQSSSGSSSSDAGCVEAIKAVSTYGPLIVTDASQAKKDVDKAEVEMIVVALDLAADAASDPQAKQSIQTLANAYLTFDDAWTNLAAPPLSDVLADTGGLQSVCS